MYPRSFLCEEAKIKQRTPLKKELCEIGEEAIWESRFTSFLFFYFFIESQIAPVACAELRRGENKLKLQLFGIIIKNSKCMLLIKNRRKISDEINM